MQKRPYRDGWGAVLEELVGEIGKGILALLVILLCSAAFYGVIYALASAGT